jgi:hypothetical protein
MPGVFAVLRMNYPLKLDFIEWGWDISGSRPKIMMTRNESFRSDGNQDLLIWATGQIKRKAGEGRSASPAFSGKSLEGTIYDGPDDEVNRKEGGIKEINP